MLLLVLTGLALAQADDVVIAGPHHAAEVRIAALPMSFPPELSVKQRAGCGGTQHCAAPSVLRLFGEPIRLASDRFGPEGGRPPLLDAAVAVEPGRFLVLGWSSGGAGHSTLHALLLSASGIEDEVVLHGWRARSCLVVERTATGWRVGVPVVRDDEGTTFVATSRERVSAANYATRLRLSAPSVPDRQRAWTPALQARAYCPPVDGSALRTAVEFAWVAVEPRGFSFSGAGGSAP